MVDIFTEHMDDLKRYWEGTYKEAKVVEPAILEKFEKNLRSMVASAMADIFIPPRSMIWAVKSFLVSIGCALSLFGVSDATANIPLLREVFGFVLYLSIYTLMLGIFLTYKGLEDILTRISKREISQAIFKAGETLDKDSETTDVEKRGRASKQTEK
jgi:hypothetical protein